MIHAYSGERAELALSMDVIYHLVEDGVFDEYMARLFDSTERFVIVYSPDADHNSADQAPHVRHRRFTDWVRRRRSDCVLRERNANPHPYRGNTGTGSGADFYVFERTDQVAE